MTGDTDGGRRDGLQQELIRLDGLLAAGDYSGATSTCQALLHRYPTSAALHEKMGDILMARELWDDAAEWYDLARQLHASPRLDDKIAQARIRARAARKGASEQPVSRWPQLWVLVGLGIAAALTITVAVLLVTGWLRARERPQAAQAPTTAEEAVGGFTPGSGSGGLATTGLPRAVRSSPAAPGSSASNQPAAQEIPGGHWAAGAPPQRAPVRDRQATRIESLTEPITDHDRLVINAVSSLTWGDDRPLTGRVDAMVDEFQGYAVIRVSVPPGVPLASLSRQIVTMAYRVGLTAVRADEAITALTVQMVRARASGSEGAVMEIVWRGNASRRNLEQYSGSADDVEALLTLVFAAVRWSPELAPPATYEAGSTPGAEGAGATR